MSKGCFITFEGIDGCGKSTQARLLGDALASKGFSLLTTREPGGTALSEKIRALLIDPANGEMVQECELLLYLAARAQHTREKIIPAIEAGKCVICDRFQDATFAYQGFGRGMPLPLLRQLQAFSSSILPDLTFIFDLPVEIAFNRLEKMNKAKDRLESSGVDFFSRIRNGYITLASEEPIRIHLLDGTKSVEELAEMVLETTDIWLKRAGFRSFNQ